MLVLVNFFGRCATGLVIACCMVFPTSVTAQTASSQQTQNIGDNDFSGTWRLKESDAAKNQRTLAIEKAIASLGRFKRGRALEVLQKATAPAKELTILDSGNQVQLSLAGQESVVKTDGLPITKAGPRGAVSLRALKQNGKLIVESKLPNATKTVVFELTDGGSILKQQVEILPSKLSSPIRFTNSYHR